MHGCNGTNPQSLNRYAYALNNPTTLTDPSGLCPPCNFKLYMPLRNDFGDEFDYGFPSGVDNEGDFFTNIDPNGLAVVESNFGAFHGSGFGGVFDTPENLIPLGPVGNLGCPISPNSLNSFLQSKGSPMTGQGENFFNTGQQYNLDPRLLVSLAGAETSFGGNITAGSYNALNVLYNGFNSPFSSFQSNINAAGKSLTNPANRYNLANTTTMYSRYCGISGPCGTLPSNLAPQGTGLYNVNEFMTQQGAAINKLHFPCD